VFDFLSGAAIVANAVVLGCEYEGMSSELAVGLRAANSALVVFFTAELAIRMAAAGLRGFVTGGAMNLFDAAVVLLSNLDTLFDVLSSTDAVSIQGTVVRIMRLLRPMRAGTWKGVRTVLSQISVALPAAANAFPSLLVFMLSAAVLGMQVFGGGYDAAVAAGALVPRLNFNRLWVSCVTVFEVLDNKNWNDTLFAYMAESGPASALCFLTIILGHARQRKFLHAAAAVDGGRADGVEPAGDAADAGRAGVAERCAAGVCP